MSEFALSPLSSFKSDSGSVLHALKHSDSLYNGFGEAYFSTVNYLAIKGWKMHTKMTLNIVVPFGDIKFCIFSPNSFHLRRELVIGESNYQRLTIFPNIWFGFQGLSEPHSILLNIADIPHDDGEVLCANLDQFVFPWSQ